MISSLVTGAGYWNPLVWLAFLILFALMGYLIYSRGNPGYKKDTEQVKPYLSGNIEPSKEKIQVKASDIYWGFVKALEGYYNILQTIHTGDLRDYILWYLGVGTIILFLLVGGV